MVSQIPALHTNVIATVRRERAVVDDSNSAQNKALGHETGFRLNSDPKEAPIVDNDNFMRNSFNLVDVNSQISASGAGTKSAHSYAAQAYASAGDFTAFSAYRSLSFTI